MFASRASVAVLLSFAAVAVACTAAELEAPSPGAPSVVAEEAPSASEAPPSALPEAPGTPTSSASDAAAPSEVDASAPELAPDAAPEPVASCFDMVRNGDEGDVDCGGTCKAKCNTFQRCNVGADCANGVCKDQKCAVPTCTDGVKNGPETDLDCGGGNCLTKCTAGKGCKVKADCAGVLACINGVCG